MKSIVSIGSGKVAFIDVQPSDEPVYTKNSKKEKQFFVRTCNYSRALDVEETVAHVNKHWPKPVRTICSVTIK